MGDLILKLEELRNKESMRNKGPLCVALHITRLASEEGLPLEPDKILTPQGGQVRGLGKGRVQSILKDHGVERVLAEEGGRTSRGSISTMKSYAAFLNELHERGCADLREIENWWVGQVKIFFASKPFKLKLDTAKSFKAIVSDLLAQAEYRQGQSTGTMIVGALLQHLVGAKIECILGEGAIQHHGSSVADAPTGRAGDFILDDVVIHVTAAPGEALMRKCKDNIYSNSRPIIVTVSNKIAVAEELAAQIGIKERIDVFDIEQFLAANVYELSKFKKDGRMVTVKEIIELYNKIVEQCESDPGLKIRLE